MAAPLTPTHKLASVLLGKPLEAWVCARRAEGMSWRLISFELWAATDKQVMVSNETLRCWFRVIEEPHQNGGEGEAA